MREQKPAEVKACFFGGTWEWRGVVGLWSDGGCIVIKWVWRGIAINWESWKAAIE